MTNLDHEEELIQQRLFNKDVVSLLFTYILRYKKYLFAALAFVLITTGTTLLIPNISRIIIDKAILNTGYIAYPESSRPEKIYLQFGKIVHKDGIRLDDRTWFIYQSSLKHFSKTEMQLLMDNNMLSKDKFSIIKIDGLSTQSREKVSLEVHNGNILKLSDTYLMKSSITSGFSVSEILQLRSGDLKKVTSLSIVMIILFSIQFIGSYLQIYVLMKLSQNAMRDLRTDLFSHVLSLELSFFDKNPVGKLVNRITNDIETLNELFSSVIVNMSQNLLIMAGVIIIMFFTDMYLASVVSITIPFLIIITLAFRSQARKAYRLIRTAIANLNTFLNENISGIRVIQIFVQERKQKSKFEKINKEVYSANIQQLNIYAVFRPLIDFFRWFAIASVIYFGAQSIMSDRISYGLIVMFLAYIGTFFEPIGELAEKIDILQNATASGEKILTIFKTQAKKELTGKSMTTGEVFQSARFHGKIVFDNVWFSYVPGEWVLKGVSFTVSPHTTLAIVGETGSGKSTIISLLSRYYEAQKGRITIDGVDIKEIPYDILRKNISTVMQDIFLFSRSIKENVILNLDWDSERFKAILKNTNADHFIEKLPNKEEEMVMERGVTFSAGERQLLAFARSLYSEPSILVLDEATSNIDTHTEMLIQDAITHMTRGRTTIAIAHRLSTVRNADNIIVLDNGVIAESGTHKVLISSRGLYYELHRLQFENA